MRKYSARLLLSTILVAGSVLGAAAQDAPRKPVSLAGKTLPLRVLTRPFAKIYKEANEASAVVQDNVPAFQPYFVYTQPPPSDLDTAGWYEVGSDVRGTVLGWMKSTDVMEWRQTMCLAYTHPQGRQPVLMFSQPDALRGALAAAAEERGTTVDSWYATIDSKKIPKDFPVLSVEPKRAVYQFIEEQFYLLPILKHEPIEIDGREGRLLKIAAATSSEAGRGATTLQDTNFVSQAVTETGTRSEKLKSLKLQVVYAIDLTTSMQPYIDATRAAIQKTAEAVASDPDLATNVQFGLWGYRDHESIEGIEFNTRNFTTQLQSAADFAKTLENVKAATVGSQGVDEDVFSGVDKALRETAWDPEALRFIVLIGDAAGHKPGEAWNQSGQTETTLRQFADDNRISLYAVLIAADEGSLAKYKPAEREIVERSRDLATTQFGVLARNRGAATEGDSFQAVPASKLDAFQTVSDQLVAVFRNTLAEARKKGEVAAVTAAAEGQAPSDLVVTPATAATAAAGAETTLKAANMVRAALVDWLGKEEEVQAPSDITAWVVDKDIKDPAVQALEVRVLVNKRDLDELRTVLQEIMLAGRQGQTSSVDFFTALQATSATLSRDPEKLKTARSLAETGLIPEFLMDLPYKSQIMSMSDEVWAGYAQDQQDEFLNNLDAKIRLYAAIHDNQQGWVKLNEGDDPDEYVHPIALDMLP